ncbi:MAG: hypothetical protein DRO06_04305, partial [Thermoproteota archaeon]
MSVRRVQSVGGGSLAITLPKSWARRAGVGPGDEVLVGEAGDILLVEPKKRRESRAVIRFSSRREAVREVLAAYLRGCDLIRIEDLPVPGLEEHREIRARISSLAGMEVVDEGSTYIEAKCLLDPSAADPREVLRRMGRLVRAMVVDSMRASARGDGELAKLVEERDDEVDRVYFLLVRVIRKALRRPTLAVSMGISPVELVDYRVAGMVVESMGDAAVE